MGVYLKFRNSKLTSPGPKFPPEESLDEPREIILELLFFASLLKVLPGIELVFTHAFFFSRPQPEDVKLTNKSNRRTTEKTFTLEEIIISPLKWKTLKTDIF